jgi:hypothetical protein
MLREQPLLLLVIPVIILLGFGIFALLYRFLQRINPRLGLGICLVVTAVMVFPISLEIINNIEFAEGVINFLWAIAVSFVLIGLICFAYPMLWALRGRRPVVGGQIAFTIFITCMVLTRPLFRELADIFSVILGGGLITGIALLLILYVLILFLPTRQSCPNCTRFSPRRAIHCRYCGTRLQSDQVKRETLLVRVLRFTHPFRRPMIVVGTAISGMIAALLVSSTVINHARVVMAAAGTVTPYPTSTAAAFVDVVTAAQDIPRTSRIRVDMLRIRSIPQSEQAPDMALSFADLVGQVALTDIFEDQTILRGSIGSALPSRINAAFPHIDPRGTLLFYQPVSGIVTTQRWMESWTLRGCEAQIVRFAVIVDGDAEQNYVWEQMVIMVWENATETWVDGQRTAVHGLTTLDATLPAEGLYSVVVQTGWWVDSIGVQEFPYTLHVSQLNGVVPLMQGVRDLNPTPTPVNIATPSIAPTPVDLAQSVCVST